MAQKRIIEPKMRLIGDVEIVKNQISHLKSGNILMATGNRIHTSLKELPKAKNSNYFENSFCFRL